jgi:hypothetical protein
VPERYQLLNAMPASAAHYSLAGRAAPMRPMLMPM